MKHHLTEEQQDLIDHAYLQDLKTFMQVYIGYIFIHNIIILVKRM